MTKAEAREKCKTDPFYLSEILGYDFQNTKDVHESFFKAFPVPKEGTSIRDWSDIKNVLLLWSRGHFKTSGVIVLIVQIILNDPDVRILLMQGNLKLTKIWLREVKSHFNGTNPKSRLLQLFPQFGPDDERTNDVSEFTVLARVRKHLKEGTVTVASPKAISTGQHYDFLFGDDLVNAVNFRNIELLDKLENEFTHFIPLLDPGCYTIVTGTRYHHADIYGRIIRRNQGEWTVSIKGCFDGPSGLLFPERVTPDGRKIGFTANLLAQIQRDDPETFAAQYLNKIITAKQHLFPESLLLSKVKSSKDPEFPKESPTIFTLDLASSKRADADHSVIAAGKMENSKIWITDVVGSTFSPFQLVVVLIQMAMKHLPQLILVEQTPSAEYFMAYARATAAEKGIHLPLQLRKYSQQKDAKYIRIAAVEKWLKQDRLFFTAGIADFELLVEQFTQFPKGRHDDRPDAVAMLVDYFQQTAGTPIAPPRLPWFVTGDGRRGEHLIFPERPDTPPMGDGFSC